MSAAVLLPNAVSVPTLAVFLVVCLQTCSGLQNITAQPGQNITLPCQTPGHKPFVAVEWTRPDLTPALVLLFMDGHAHPKQQHPSFRSRADLLDRDMRDGNVSLSLSNVSSQDSGIYECRVKEDDGRRRRVRGVIESPPVNAICLSVTEPGDSAEESGTEGNGDGHAWLAASLSVAVLATALTIGYGIFRSQANRQSSYTRPSEHGTTRV